MIRHIKVGFDKKNVSPIQSKTKNFQFLVHRSNIIQTRMENNYTQSLHPFHEQPLKFGIRYTLLQIECLASTSFAYILFRKNVLQKSHLESNQTAKFQSTKKVDRENSLKKIIYLTIYLTSIRTQISYIHTTIRIRRISQTINYYYFVHKIKANKELHYICLI